VRIARVFPRKTKASPTDDLAFFGEPGLFPPEVDAVHVSVAFSWDLPEAERLAKEWERVAPVSIGGPATGQRGEEFTPGMYLKPGYTITSRGCPNKCWFCDVWRRDGDVMPLQIRDGWNVLDDNLLACPDEHIRAVFAMLHGQKALGHRIEFTGGLEAARLKDWHVDALRELRPKQMFFAYDTPDDLEPLMVAAEKLAAAGWTARSKTIRCYVLIWYLRDTFNDAQKRLERVVSLGMCPMAMLWRDDHGETDKDWRRFQRQWARPAMIEV
jgi:hypothetical protein